MNETRELLERVGERFAFPEQAFEGFLRRRDRKRRNQRIAAGVVAIAVLAAPVWIVTTGGRSDDMRTPASTGPTVAPADAVPVGLIGLPAEGATPSSPMRGELVLSFMSGHTGGDPGRFSVYVYADGRLIREGLTNSPTGLLEQRLTPEGVELVRAEVTSTGLFDHDLHLISTYGLYYGQIQVRKGDRLVRVTWGDCCGPGPEDVATEMPATPEQVSALQRLDVRLADPASWLPASVWEDPAITAYVPSKYSVCYEAKHGVGLARVLASLPRPAERLLRTWDRTHEGLVHSGPDPGTSLDIWCSEVTTEEARALAQIFDDAGVREPQEDVFGLRYVFEQRDPGTTEVSLSMGPLLPHET